jgi:hypothetical protein
MLLAISFSCTWALRHTLPNVEANLFKLIIVSNDFIEFLESVIHLWHIVELRWRKAPGIRSRHGSLNVCHRIFIISIYQRLSL